MSKIDTFRPELVRAFEKMITGINIEISETLRNESPEKYKGRWWFILAINSDETLHICSQTHTTIDGVKLKDVIL